MKISVALCTCNGEKFIAEQVNSILSQTRLPDEIVLSDDASTDATLTIVKSLFQNTRVKTRIVENKSPLKTIRNFSQAISLCSGDWIFLCDQDDVWDTTKIERMADAFSPSTFLLFTNGRLINNSGELTGSSLWEAWGFTEEKKGRWKNNYLAFSDLLNHRNFVTGATAAINRKLLPYTLPIQAPKGFYHDAWFALHAAARGGLRWLDECTISYRVHENQQVGISRIEVQQPLLNNEFISFETFQRNVLKRYPAFWLRHKLGIAKKMLKGK